jgi:hypothetical protein
MPRSPLANYPATLEFRPDPGAEPVDPGELDDLVAELLLAMLVDKTARPAPAPPARGAE